ncbi:MAG TPA: hypothetical protein DDY68_05590 [Porphyromonadaceae bacterium]|nr:hypothetical protein [Porphyromonadaceae bacterium]
MKKRVVSIVLLLVCFASVTRAVGFLGIGEHLGVGVGVGVFDGISVEADVALTKWCTGRVGVDFMPGISISYNDRYSFTTNGASIDQINSELTKGGYKTINSSSDCSINGSLKRTQFHVIFDVYPLTDICSFFVSAGFYFSGKRVIDLKGNVKEWKNIQQANQDLATMGSPYRIEGINLADYNLSVDNNGDLYGGVEVNGFRPYLGLGFGRAIPKGRIGFRFEMGVQFHGSPKIVDSNGGDSFSKAMDQSSSSGKIKDIVENVKVLPMLKFSICGRIF